MLSKNMEDTEKNQIKFPLEKINSIYDVTEKEITESEDITMKTWMLNKEKSKLWAISTNLTF